MNPMINGMNVISIEFNYLSGCFFAEVDTGEYEYSSGFKSAKTNKVSISRQQFIDIQNEISKKQ